MNVETNKKNDASKPSADFELDVLDNRSSAVGDRSFLIPFIVVPIIFSVLIGSAFVFFTPPFAAHDELYHWRRVQHLSQADVFTDRLGVNDWGGEIDKRAFDFSLYFLREIEGKQAISKSQARNLAQHLHAQPEEPSVIEFSSTAIFTALPYLPQAIGVGMARFSGADLLTQLQVGRLFNLLCYIALAAITLAILPSFRIMGAAFLFAPTALYLATSLSADPINFILPTLLLAVCWRAKLKENKITVAEQMTLALLFLTMAMLKPPYLIYCGLALIIPRERFGSIRKKITSIGLLALPAVVFAVAWNLNYPFIPGIYWQTGADPAAMIDKIIGDPLGMFSVVVGTVRDWYFMWWLDSYGRFGGHPAPYSLYVSHNISYVAFFLYALGSIANVRPKPDYTLATVSIVVASLSFMAILLAFLIAFTAPTSLTVDGIQGRYFHFIILLFFLAFGSIIGGRLERGLLRGLIFSGIWITHAVVDVKGLLHLSSLWI